MRDRSNYTQGTGTMTRPYNDATNVQRERKRRNGDTRKGTHASAVVERDLHFSLERSVRSAIHRQAEAADLGQERELCSVLLSAGLCNCEHKCAHMQ